MSDDLISRKELRKAFKKCPFITGASLYHARQLIDNAPTVEPFEPDYVGDERLKARQRGYEEGYHMGMKIGKTLNPKIKRGEWIEDSGNIACSNCHTIWLYRITDFCPNCGADMRKEAEK